MKKIYKYVLGILIGIMFYGTTVFAAEVTPVNAVLASNEKTVVYAEADLSGSVILPDLQAGLPVQVTGITDNGFFQVSIGQTFYVPGYGLSQSQDITVLKPAQVLKEVPQEIYNVEQIYHEQIMQVIAIVNQERVKAGLAPLTYDEQISYAATQRSYEMAQNSYFEHARPDGRICFTVMKEYGIPYWNAGENIAWGQKTPEYVMYRWMNSPGHRANILRAEYTKIGVGIARDAKGRLYWTQLFAS